MGQDQSKTDTPSRELRPNPKFQLANARSKLTASTTTSPVNVPRPSTSVGSKLSSSLPSERATNIQTDVSIEVTLENHCNKPSCSNTLVHKPTEQKTVNTHYDASCSTSEVQSSNQSIKDTSTKSRKHSENLRFEEVKSSVEITSAREQPSAIDQSLSVENYMLQSKIESDFEKLPKPERDIRHVPTYKKQIHLNNTSVGNPFLSDDSNNTLAERKFNVQINSKKKSGIPESEKHKINERLENIYKSGDLERGDLDRIAIETLNKLPVHDALDVLDSFLLCNPKSKMNKSAYLCSMIKNRINGKNLDNDTSVGQVREPRERLLPTTSFSMFSSSQNNPQLYFGHAEPSPGKSSDIVDSEGQFALMSNQTSHMPTDPEIQSKYQSPSKEFIFEKQSINEEQSLQNIRKMNTFGNLENEHFTRENAARKFKESLNINKFEHQIPVTLRSSKSVSKNPRKFKRDLPKIGGIKSHSVKSSTYNALKDVEKIAESLFAFNETKHQNISSALKESSSSVIHVVESKDKSKTISLEDCIIQMKNEFQPEKQIVLLQQSLFSNLEVIDSFITGLKSFPYLTDQIIYQINVLKENMSSFPTNLKGSPLSDDMDFSVNTTNNTIRNTEKPQRTSSVVNENADLELKRYSTTIERSEYKENSSGSLKSKEMNQLGEKHLGLLDLIYSSRKKKCVFNNVLYMCVLCDLFNPDQDVILQHVNQHRHEEGSWHSCNYCNMVIFGTEVDLQAHCLSEQHCNIMRLKLENIHSNEVIKTELEEEKDDISICSSNGVRKKPHEILLLISKDCQSKYAINGPVGLFCRVCNRYFRFNTNTKVGMNQSANHLQMHWSKGGVTRNKLYSCVTCHVDLFGDQSLWNEHKNMDLHKELAFKGNTINKSNQSETRTKINQQENILSRENEPQVLSDGEGPHYELMKEVLMLHVNNKLGKNILGFYCYFCKFYTFDEKHWDSHISDLMHVLFCDAKMRKCSLCKLNIFCDDNVFVLHEQSSAHKAISKLPKSNSGAESGRGSESYEEGLDDEYEYIEDENDDEEYSNPTTSSNQGRNYESLENTQRMTIGVTVTGLTPGISKRDLFLKFKEFGIINSCYISKSGKTANVLYRDKKSVNAVFRRKDIYIRNTKINVHRLNTRSRKDLSYKQPSAYDLLSGTKIKSLIDELS